MNGTMRVVEYERYGPADVCQLRQRTVPVPGASQVLVRVRAAALNPKDVLLRAGKYPLLAGVGFPKRLAYDFAGELAAVGSRVASLKVGDSVYGMLQWRAGAAAEYCLASPAELALKPASLSFEQAAALPLTALTALQALRDDGRLAVGQRVLVHGASGGVGVAAVQLAKALGAHVTSVSSAANRELLMNLGSDAWYGYEGGSMGAEGAPYDLFFDVFGNRSRSDTRALLTATGRYVSTVPKPHVIRDRIWTAVLSSVSTTQTAHLVVVRSRSADLAQIAQHVEAGRLRPVIQQVYPLAEVIAAQRQVESKHTRGKVVLRV